MTALAARLRAERDRGRTALVPFLTAGDPGLDETVAYAEALVAGGADVLELGVPFSDPLADGPVIQRATDRALRAGVTPRDVLACAARIRERTGVPLVLMSYLNPVLRFGWEAFVRACADAGVAGLILTDLPPEEAGPYLPAAAAAGLGTVFLVAPTSDDERIRRAAAATTGFLYCVSRLGVTGPRSSLSADTAPLLARVRRLTDLPVGLGFGISTPAHAREAARAADAVIVGSALVRLAEEAGAPGPAATSLREAARALRSALDESDAAGAPPAD